MELDKIHHRDCLELLPSIPDESIDLIFTSPPYADNRKKSYKGVPITEYVDWFLPRSEHFLRVLKPEGSFVLNIKERAVNGERQTYVLELILALREQGWLWTEEYIWHKKNSYPGEMAEQVPRRVGEVPAFYEVKTLQDVPKGRHGPDGRLEKIQAKKSEWGRPSTARV